MAAIVVAPTATSTAKTRATAPWTFRFRFGLINRQSASAQVSSVECGDGLVGLTGVAHFHEPEPPGAAGIPVGHECDLFHCAVRLEEISQFAFARAVGQIPNVKVLHRNSSLSKSSRVDGVGFADRPSESRGGWGSALIALLRAKDAERTAEIRREASRMPHR